MVYVLPLHKPLYGTKRSFKEIEKYLANVFCAVIMSNPIVSISRLKQ